MSDFGNQGPDFGEMTRSLNTIISRLAFHDMRIQANRVFVQQIQDQMHAISLCLGSENGEISEDRRLSLNTATRSLEERLIHLMTEHQALGLEIGLNQRIAQSQVEIVSQ
ncbi:uncharacterized protein N0V89_006401 [Didymosphaeria variabile]|uniref:Uncharacterized protein n=1 Tax=Didymosphaeria variabile TaxID=1932322 RepID=A0A9W8XNA2_9PLEO|nr:uncharacterized protein N0V89_006401 [Didymosphaeria variabile]KAJ4354664.1 hypothetical protein N0V89_006401 [Didymosphaeria variabile]